MTSRSDNNSGNRVIGRYLGAVIGCALALPVLASEPETIYSSMPAVDCVINPYRVADISSPVAGVIKKLYVDRSQKVNAGQVVAQLDASVEHANVELAKYRATVQSEIGLSQVNMDFDNTRKIRIDTLYAKQNISRENADQASREAQLSKWKLQQANELSQVRKLELRRAQAQLRQKSIRAPFAGYVLDTFKHQGEHVEEQAIIRLAQLDPLVIETIVPMENFGSIKTGMLAEIRADVLVSEKLLGKVTAVDLIGDVASNTFGVKLTMPNPQNRIPAGLKCIVKFIEPAILQVAEDEAPAGPVKPETLILSVDSPAISKQKVAAIAAPENAKPQKFLVAMNDSNLTETSALNGSGALQIAVLDQRAEVVKRDELSLISATKKTPDSYMVSIKQADTNAATRDIIKQLRNAGVKDLLELDYGANKGLISLGVYNNLPAALTRQNNLASLGFTAFLVERFR